MSCIDNKCRGSHKRGIRKNRNMARMRPRISFMFVVLQGNGCGELEPSKLYVKWGKGTEWPNVLCISWYS